MAEQKIRLSLSIQSSIYVALAEEAGAEKMDVSDLAEIILEKHAANGSYLSKADRDEILLYRELVGDVKDMAVKILEANGFSESITADAIAACVQIPSWRDKYENYIGDDAYRNGNPKKQNINPSFGYWVKKTLGASSKMKDGKPENRKVSGAIIQSYTPLEKS